MDYCGRAAPKSEIESEEGKSEEAVGYRFQGPDEDSLVEDIGSPVSPHKNHVGLLLIKPVPELFVNSLEIVNKENDNLGD